MCVCIQIPLYKFENPRLSCLVRTFIVLVSLGKTESQKYKEVFQLVSIGDKTGAGTHNPAKPHSNHSLINLSLPPTGWPRIQLGLRLNRPHFINFPFFTLPSFLVLTFSSHESSSSFYSSFRKPSSHMFLLYGFHDILSMWLIPSSGWLLWGDFCIILGLGIHFLPVSDNRDCLPKCPQCR